MEGIITFALFILIIGVLVFVHELGHFLAAKLSKVEVVEFAIGFGPKLFSRKYKGTLYSINAIPLGGYVNLEGEKKDSGPGSFRQKNFFIKFFVLIAGVTMNIIFAIFFFGLFLLINNYKIVIPGLLDYSFLGVQEQKKVFPIQIVGIPEGSRSEGYFREGELIVAINNQFFSSYDEFLAFLIKNQNKETEFTLFDFSNYQEKRITVQVKEKRESGAILDLELVQAFPDGRPAYVLYYRETFLSAFPLTLDMFVYQLKALGSLLSNAFSSGDFSEIGESVGGLPLLADQVNKVVVLGEFGLLIFLTALVSISLAFINILPFPALDGGQIVVFGLESVFRKKIPDRILNGINLTGFGLLILLAIAINMKDVIQLNWLGGIGDFLKQIFGR